MLRTAVRVDRWMERGSPINFAVPGPGPTPGVPILQQQFPLGSGQLNIQVELAWGANPYATQSTWGWTDVTHYVKYEQAININPGRTDESSTPQPSQCTFTVDNRTGLFSQGGQSPNYPNVKRGVPVRVSIWYQGVQHVRFLGYVASFTPGWDTTGTYSVVAVVAAGVKRRYAQNQAIELSTLTRTIPTGNPVAYWPLEEGALALSGSSLVTNGTPMVPVDLSLGLGTIDWGSDTQFAGTSQSPVLKAGEALNGSVTGCPSSAWSVMWGENIDPATGAQTYIYNSSFTTEVLTYTDGSVDVITTPVGTFSGTTVISIGPAGKAPGNWNWFVLSCTQSGGSVIITLAVNGGNISATMTSTVLGPVTSMTLASPTGTTGPTGFSQAAVFGQYWTALSLNITGNGSPTAFSGYAGEYAQDRMVRLAAEEGEFISVASGHRLQRMGPQTQDTYINLLEAAALVDGGVLYDGFAQGLSYVSHDEMTSQSQVLGLDASLGQLADQVSPIDDDQYTVNQYSASRTNGATVVYTDSRSSQQPNQIGTYDNSNSFSAFSDGQQLIDLAGWRVNLGTFAGYRYPSIEMWMHRNPELLSGWLAATLESRVSVSNLIDVRTQLANGSVRLLLEGYSETIDQFLWSITGNCTPYDPWLAGEYAQATADTNPFVWRVDTDGSALATDLAPGASFANVSVTAGALWTLNTDDLPVNVLIGGWEVGVTSISGSTSPQTFTLSWYSPLPTRTIPAGSAVSLADVTVIDIAAM